MNTDASLVVLTGGNAAGKTTFLEALNVLFYGSSFRTRHSSQLITRDTGGYLVRAQASDGSDNLATEESVRNIATERLIKGESRYRLDGEDVRVSSLVRAFPLQVIDDSIFDLVEGPPSDRRRFLDWGLFHVKHEFYPLWKKHKKLLGHWGALLKRGARVEEFSHWKAPFVETSTGLTELRRDYLADLESEIKAQLASFPRLAGSDSPVEDMVSVDFQQGWPEQAAQDYADFLDQSLEKDIKERRLRSGAHLFDVSLKVNGRPLRETFSRGQKKLFGLKLKLAQIKLYNSLLNKTSCIVLVDDLAAELDAENQRTAIRELLASGSQVFLTGIEGDKISTTIPEGTDVKMFHVKQGLIEELL